MKKILLLVILLSALSMYSQEEKLPPEVALVYPIAPRVGEIVIDGDLYDEGWKSPIKAGAFTDSGSPNLAIEQTEMALCYDDKYFYLAMRCFESNMRTLVTPSSGHDASFWNDDSIEFFIDDNHDHSTHYQFAVTANGSQFDGKNNNSTWNASWKAAVKRYADSWCVEVAIPFDVFKRTEDGGQFEPVSGAFWGFNACRERRAGGKHELFNWADVQRVFNRTHLFGHLLFMPSGWQSNTDAISQASQAAGRTETQIILSDGYWSIKAGDSTPRKLTFKQSCIERFSKLPPQAEELAEMFSRLPSGAYKTEFEDLLQKFNEWNIKANKSTSISAIEFSQGNVFYLNFLRKLNSFFWKAKLAELNSKI